MKKVAAITFGCKVNQYETSCILDEFTGAGYQIVEFDMPADVYVINSCTVTNRTDYKSRNAVRKALNHKAEDGNVKIVVTGCYAQLNREEIAQLGDVDLIVDNNNKGRILDIVEQADYHFENVLDAQSFEDITTSQMQEKSRAFLKVQDGCDFYCAYCTIPFARGHSRSRSKLSVLEQVRKLVASGYHEFVLGGINLGFYGKDLEGDYSLADLMSDIASVDGVEIIRLSSIEPQLIDDKLLQVFADNSKIASHFHVPLQSGCDELLKSMNRHYDTAEFATQIGKLRKVRPDVSIGIDLIVGLPGETDELFSKTEKFLVDLDFTYLHVFSYSKRKGTKAAEMKGQVNGKVITKRNNQLTRLSEAKKAKYTKQILENKTLLGGIVETKQDGYYTSLSDHYVRIYFQSAKELEKQYIKAVPVELFRDGLKVKLVD